MSSARARLLPLLVSLTLILSACGFHPLYSGRKGDALQQGLSNVEILPISNRNGQLLRNALIDTMHGDRGVSNAAYQLKIELVETQGSLGIQRDATATFAQLAVYATYSLTELRSGRVVMTGLTRTLNTYSLPDAGFGVVVSRDDSTARAMQELSEDISTRVAVFLRRQP